MSSAVMPDPVASFDDTMIAGYSYSKNGSSETVLISNAVGVCAPIWTKILGGVADERRLMTWDHRGLHASGPSATDRIDPGAHAEDAVAVLDHYEVDTCAVVAWSTGCRVAVEIASRYPERVFALVLVCGGYGTSLRTGLRNLEATPLLPFAAGLGKHFTGLLRGPVSKMLSRPELAGFVRQSGFVGPTADIDALVEVLRASASCDLRSLFETFEAVAGDAAPEIASTIEAPTLIIGGGSDAFIPVRVLEDVASRIPQARLEIYDRATHFLPIEYPERLNEDIAKFLAQPTTD